MFSPLDNVTFHPFPNGLRLYLKEDRTWPLVSVQAWVRVGSVDEEAAAAGVSHVLEHMVLKGTTHHAAADISRWVESQGGALNAETAKEYTHYYIDVPSVGTRKAVHLLAELLHRAALDPEEWKRECPVILEEIKRRNDDPDALLWDLLNEALYDDPCCRRPVIGYPETVGRIDRDALARFYRAHYTAGRCLMVIAGDFKSRDVLRWVEAEFAGMPAGEPPAPRRARSAARARQIGVRKAVKQAYAGFGFATPPSSHGDHEALDLIAAILGDGRGARLVRILREEKKLVWSVDAANLTQEGPGLFAVFCECRAENLRALKRELGRIFIELRRFPPGAQELTRAKNILQTAWLQGFETYHNQAATLGGFALENQLPRLRSYLPRLRALSRSDVSRVIGRYFGLSLACAVIQA